MDQPASRLDPIVERWAVRLYRALLVWYPVAFRAAHGLESASLFGEICRDDWRHRRRWMVARRVMTALASVPGAGLAERRLRRREARTPFAAAAWGFGGSGFGGDLKYACRAIARRPALSAAIVGTLALGIGTNTAAFSVLDVTALRPTPYVNARRVMVLEGVTGANQADVFPKATWVRTWATELSQTLEHVEARRTRLAVLAGAGPATETQVLDVTPGYLSSIGVRPVLGRLLSADDARPGATPVAVITQALWRGQFGQRADILGLTVTLDRTPYQIVGVVPTMDDLPGVTSAVATALTNTSSEPVYAVAWLRADVSLATAQRAVAKLAPILDHDASEGLRLAPPSNPTWEIPIFRDVELGMGIASVAVWVIAGVNVVNLLLVLGESRRGELAVRRALGASPQRLVRLMLLEVLVLTLAAAAIGLMLAAAIVHLLTALDAGPQLQTQLERIRLSPLIVAYTVGSALAMTAAVGLVPALRGARGPAASLRESGSRSASRLRRGPSMLVAVETALSALLLAVAGVVAHSFAGMLWADRGFDAQRVLSVNLVLPPDRYPTASSQDVFFGRLLNDVTQLPGVERAALGYGATVPFDILLTGQWTAAGPPRAPLALEPAISWVTPGYFSLMGIPLLQGRDFAAGDAAAGTSPIPPAIVSRSLARHFWGEANAVGGVLEDASPRGLRRFQVIGVADDLNVWSLLRGACRCDEQLYAPLSDARRSTDILLRIHAGAPLPVAGLRAAIARLDPTVPSDGDLRTAEEGLREFIQIPRFTSAIFGAFAILAVLLVAVGLSAVVSHAVAQRTREMGIRLALGATLGRVRRLVILQGLRPAVLGLAAGLSGALLVTRYLTAILYGMNPRDTLTFVAAPVVLLAIAVTALTVPAVRATRVDPVQALRAD